MKINLTYIILAISVLCLWGLRRIGVDDATADIVITLLMVALGVAPGPAKPPAVGPVAVVFIGLAALVVAMAGEAAASVAHSGATHHVVHHAPHQAARTAITTARTTTTVAAAVAAANGRSEEVAAEAEAGGCSTAGPSGRTGAVVVLGALAALLAWRWRRAVLLALLALSASACSPTVLTRCTLQISRSGPDGDRLVCEDHDPIRLKHVDGKLRDLLLREYGGAPR